MWVKLTVLLSDNYDNRNAICDKLDNIYQVEEFKWKNQSTTS